MTDKTARDSHQILILTDIHVGSNKLDKGIDNDGQISLAVDLINEHCADADLLVMMGDLTDKGTPEQYRRFKELIGPLQVPVQLMIGNHDDVENYTAAFPETVAGDGFVHASIDLGNRRLVFLDTVQRSDARFAAFGELCEKRLQWLDRELAEAAGEGREALIFMHHPPMALGLPLMDCIRLVDGPAFYETIGSHGNVAHIFCGHIHRYCQGMLKGIPVTSFKAVTQQAPLFFGEIDPNAWTAEPGAFGVVSLGKESMIIHSQDLTTARLEIHTSDFADEVADGKYDPEMIQTAQTLLTRP